MLKLAKTYEKLIHERQVIQANINRIEDLSQDLVNLADLKEDSEEITPFQSCFVNEKRVNLRHNIIDLKEGLQIHYNLGEEVLKPLIGSPLLKSLVEKHKEILKKLSEMDSVILNLSPLGILFNSSYLKGQISNISRVLQNLICQESSLLAFSGISRNEEPA